MVTMLTPYRNNHSPIEIIAHRGASFTAPENTLASIRLGWEQNADAVEIDVQLTRDKRVVVLHDNTTKRTTGKNLKVSETSSRALRKLDAGSFKSKEFAGQKIPFIEEVIPTIPDNRRLFIEIKDGKETVLALREIIIGSGNLQRMAIIGFDLETISTAKKIFPETPVYWLCNKKRNNITLKPFPHVREVIEMAKECDLDGLSIHFESLTRDSTEAVLSSGLKLYAWTVNDLDEAERLVNLGVHGITTDRPGWIINNIF